MTKKTEQTGKEARISFTDMAEAIEKKSPLVRLGKILDEIAGDVRWGRKSLVSLAFGGAALGAFGLPSLMTAIQPYIQPSLFTALLSTSMGAGVAGGAFGIAVWGIRGIAGTVNAGIRSIKKNGSPEIAAKRKTRKLKRKTGRLPAKDPSKLNFESDKFIVRNGILYAVSEEAGGRNNGIKVMPGITAIDKDAFRWDNPETPLTLWIPESVLAFHPETMPLNTCLVFSYPMSKLTLPDSMQYDPVLRKHVLEGRRFDIPGGTYQSHLYQCSILEEDPPRPPLRLTPTAREDLELLGKLSEDKQRTVLNGAYESMIRGNLSISDFRNIVKFSTIPIQEFKGPVEKHCSGNVIDTGKRQWYINETIRREKGNPSITEMNSFLQELRRVSAMVREKEPATANTSITPHLMPRMKPRRLKTERKTGRMP